MGDSTPICRCRVLYLGSAVPRQSKDGLQGIQEPLRSLYPSEGAVGAKGIDSWLSVWSNGILLENVDENRKQVTRFFPIESLHYCAAVRQVLIPERGNTNPEPKFLPLDSPFARMPKAQHPPIFAAILRRTTGIKVLECHVFICKREAAANALVRCCFHAYADNSYARQLEGGSSGSVYGTLGGSKSNGDLASGSGWRSRAGSTTTLNSVGRHSTGHLMNGLAANGGINSIPGSNGSTAEGYTAVKNLSRAYTPHDMNGLKDDRASHVYASSADLNVVDDGEGSIYNGDENHKVWNGSQDRLDGIGMESPYEVFSGGSSTLGRPQRARQISAPIPVPPPPLKDDSKKKRDKKSKYSGSQSLSGTLIRPKPIHANSLQRPGLHPPPGSMIYGPLGPQPSRQYHTFSHRAYANGGHGIPPGPQLLPPMGMPMQMPVMIAPQYATLQPARTSKKKKKDKMNGIPVGMPVPPPMFAYQPQAGSQSMIPEPRPLGMSNRKLAQSVGGGLDDSGNSGAESPGGTGIYRRKGHLNERAFSYSIRQEHRSRSHGSLASLQFNPPDMKKEREIAQMVAGLELNDDSTLHRRNPGPPIAASGYGPAGNFGKPRR